MDWTVYLTLFIALLAITNPIGNLAIFIALVSDISPAMQRKTAIQAGLAIFVILAIVTWVGPFLLAFFGISSSAFETAGALIIILLGLSMLNGHDHAAGHSAMHHTPDEAKAAKQKESVAVVPLAIPIVAGPGAITTLIVHTHATASIFDKMIVTVLCAILAMILFLCFYFSSWIQKYVGVNGIKVATRIMGLILVAIAFQMLGDGLKHLLPGLS